MTVDADGRRAYIVEQVQQGKLVKVGDLSDYFGVSTVSIRRDLDRLEEHGYLKRIHGGAVPNPDAGLGESYAAKMRRNLDEKQRIGHAAARMIGQGDSLILDSGTTTLQVARHIDGDLLTSGLLTVITHSLAIVRELGSWRGVQLIILGGVYRPDYELTVGPQTVADLKGLHADKLIIGTDGLTLAGGATANNMLEAEVYRAMSEAADQVIVVADSSKIGVTGVTTIIPVDRIGTLVTDTDASPAIVNNLRERGTKVVLA
jgi:DeoR family transcriptional regulator of aga operon